MIDLYISASDIHWIRVDRCINTMYAYKRERVVMSVKYGRTNLRDLSLKQTTNLAITIYVSFNRSRLLSEIMVNEGMIKHSRPTACGGPWWLIIRNMPLCHIEHVMSIDLVGFHCFLEDGFPVWEAAEGEETGLWPELDVS